MTPAEALQNSGLDRLEARILLQAVTGRTAVQLITWPDKPLSSEENTCFWEKVTARKAGQPIAYLIGEREFYGHRFKVSPAVLIPRPETEALVDKALECVQKKGMLRILELGTGSGAIAISIALACPQVQLTATDISAPALAVAQDNAHTLGARLQWYEGSWFHALPPETPLFDLILSNPPYISRHDPHLKEGDVRFEPRLALTDEQDGLQPFSMIIQAARSWLKPEGELWFEHGYDQAPSVRALFQEAGYQHIASEKDLAGWERITGAQL